MTTIPSIPSIPASHQTDLQGFLCSALSQSIRDYLDGSDWEGTYSHIASCIESDAYDGEFHGGKAKCLAALKIIAATIKAWPQFTASAVDNADNALSKKIGDERRARERNIESITDGLDEESALQLLPKHFWEHRYANGYRCRRDVHDVQMIHVDADKICCKFLVSPNFKKFGIWKRGEEKWGHFYAPEFVPDGDDDRIFNSIN